MQANQLTCPQCGLVNNHLAEACAQCGIIFVKNQAVMDAQALRDEHKKKAIEEAEAMLNGTLPPSGRDAFGDEIVKRIDLPEDTIEMRIPVEEATSAPQEPELEKNQDPDMRSHEIGMEDIETAPEGQIDAIDTEELFLSEIAPTQTARATVAETAETGKDIPGALERGADSSQATVTPEGVQQDDTDQEKVDAAAQQSETAPPLARDHAAAKAGTAEEEIAFEEEKHSPAGRQEALQSWAQIRPEAMTEMPPVAAPATIRAKNPVLKAAQVAQKRQQQQQVLEALKRQREKQTQSQALSQEQAAQAGAGTSERQKLARAKAEALKKQKLAQAKAEALKKQKMAQAKALALKKQRANQARLEVLKKQKEAQAKAEASAQEIEVASAGILPAASKSSAGNHERLLGLLKKYKGKAIGINYDNSAEIKAAELVDANEEFFSVMVKDKKLQYSYPLKTILTIVEGQEGVEAGDEGQKTKFDAVIKVFPLVLY